jgi:uroporphyrinogen decarboxylase
MEDCLSGRTPDRPPVSLWRHFPVDDQNPETLSEAVFQFQNLYDWDFVKVTPASSFCIRDYGVVDEWRGNPEGTREYITRPIQMPQRWNALKPLDVHSGALKSQLLCLEKLLKRLPKDTPILQTIFDPMSQAKNLAGRQELLVHMRQFPDLLHKGLEILCENNIRFIRECKKIGIDGIFLAVQHAQVELVSREEFGQFVYPYALRILDEVTDLWCNLLHIHGKGIYFTELSTLPVEVFNWHDQETDPSLSKGKETVNGVVCGGLKQWDTLAYGTPDTVQIEAERAITETRGTRFILGTGCVMPVIAPHGNISTVRQSVEK